MDRLKNHIILNNSDRNREKKIGRAKILYFVSGQTWLGPKFQFRIRARPGPKFFFFTSGRAEIVAMRPGPGLKNAARADL